MGEKKITYSGEGCFTCYLNPQKACPASSQATSTSASESSQKGTKAPNRHFWARCQFKFTSLMGHAPKTSSVPFGAPCLGWHQLLPHLDPAANVTDSFLPSPDSSALTMHGEVRDGNDSRTFAAVEGTGHGQPLSLGIDQQNVGSPRALNCWSPQESIFSFLK